jgi:hypothetical protein
MHAGARLVQTACSTRPDRTQVLPRKKLTKQTIMKCKTMQVDKGKRMLPEKKNKLLATSREGMS